MAGAVSDELTTVRGTGGAEARPARNGAEAGTTIGRYVVLAVAGSGASGVVYAAYDPELDRKVALKVLGAGDDGESTRSEVLHEARALAKLRDAHVVAVHDVGEHQGRVFVVMEFVDGQDLALWIGSERPGVAEVVRALAQAARGLQAAHDDGIVHRDFKPANALIGSDGTVFVADFGLARFGPRRTEAAQTDEPVGVSTPPGTPAYLAPELYEGGEAGTRSDIYAFCVTLWEALYGSRPWAAGNEFALLDLKRDGPPDVPARPRVPRRVKALLVAGLDPHPERRPASMADVLRELEPPSSRLPWMMATGFLTIAAVSGWALTQADPCGGGSERVGQVWSSARQTELAKGIVDEESRRFFSARAQAHADAWVSVHREACEATHVRHEQSPERLDQRMQCLDRRLSQFETLLAEVNPAQSEDVMRATRALATMTDRRCPTEAGCDPTPRPSSWPTTRRPPRHRARTSTARRFWSRWPATRTRWSWPSEATAAGRRGRA